MSFEEEFLAKIAEALNVPADLLGQDYLGTLTQTELQAYEASRRFWRESYRMQVAYERTGIADFLKTPPIDESTIMFDSPPCRSMAPFVSSLVLDGEAFVTSEGDQISPERVAIISGDYGPVGMRVLAAYADPRVRSILLDMETLDRFNAIEPNHQLRMYALGLMIADRPKKVAKKPPPAYLKHDPTKKHSRRRRK